MIYRAAGPAMAFKLIQPAQDRWRAVNCWRSLQPARSRPSAAARWRPASSLSVIVAAPPAAHDPPLCTRPVCVGRRATGACRGVWRVTLESVTSPHTEDAWLADLIESRDGGDGRS